MIRMRRVVCALLVPALYALVAPHVGIAADGPAGTWRVQFVTPLGQHAVNMTINQAGSKLTGNVTDEYGEYPIAGKFADGWVTVVWSVTEEGRPLEITMSGRLEGNVINGTARLGDVGEGTLVARRTGDAGP